MGGRGPGAQIIALTFRTACDDLTPQARGADPKQRCLELKTELEQNYKACTLYILSIFNGFLFIVWPGKRRAYPELCLCNGREGINKLLIIFHVPFSFRIFPR